MFYFFASIQNTLLCQPYNILTESNCCNDSILNSSEDSVLYTPLGPALKSKVHYVDGKHYLRSSNDRIQLINTKTGKICQEFQNQILKEKVEGTKDLSSTIKRHSSILDLKSDTRGLTYAICEIIGLNPEPIKYFNTSWIVPSPPQNQSDQIIYLWNGLFNIVSGTSYLLQPVLQWGKTPAGGGNYWAICNWFLTSSDFFHDTLIKVDPGTNLQGIIELTSVSDSLYSYNSSFKGYSSSLQIDGIPKLTEPQETLEAYFVNNCDQYPLDDKIRFFDIDIWINNSNPDVIWLKSDENTDCGQFCKLVLPTSKDGIVDIYYRTPPTKDYFDIIHIFPNPVEDIIHITSLRPIQNFKIEIFNSLGYLIKTTSDIKIDIDFNNPGLNLQYSFSTKNYSPGLYLIKVYYEDKTHVFKIIKN